MILLFFVFLSSFLLIPHPALADEWVPLIQAADFLGIKTDVLTTVTGVISIILIILGCALLVRSFGR